MTSYLAAVVQSGTDAISRRDHIGEDLAANAARIVGWIRRLNDELPEPPKLIGFPVLPLVGASKRPVAASETAMSLDGALDRPLDTLVDACARYGCYLGLSVVERTDIVPGGFMHSGIILGPDGLVLRQPKFMQHRASEIPDIRYRYRSWVERLGLEGAHRVAETPIGRLSCIIEVEHWVPEMVRTRVKQGVDVLLHPNLEFRDVDAPFTAIKQTIAFQNHLYLISANAAFERWPDGDVRIFRKGRGDSSIVGPTGQILARCDQLGPDHGEGYAVATIDLDQVRAARERYSGETTPVWDLYGSTYQGEGRKAKDE